MTRLIPLVVLFLVVVPLHAATITVDANGPADFSAIQPALDAATAGDVILVADGIYTGPGNRNLAFGGKNITLRSQNGPAACVINCQRQDRAFYIRSDEGPSCLIEGFTIINGTDYDGGAVYCYRASPTIRNCLLADNHASGGGGAIACRYGSPTIDGCIVRNNTANYGGGIQCQYDAEATIVACTIVDNRARYSGGGIDCDSDRPTRIVNCVIAENLTDRDGGAVSVGSDATPIITNCTIAANFAGNDGGGVFCEYRGSPKITNCVFADNFNHAIYEDSTSAEPEVSFCLFDDNGNGDYYDADDRRSYMGAHQLNVRPGFHSNISGEPAFAFPDDFHLTPGSACLDAGTNDARGGLPAVDIEGGMRVLDGSRAGAATVDIGAYEYDPDRSTIALSPPCFEFVREVNGPNPEDQVLKIRNSAVGRLNWRIEEQCSWLTVSPVEGVAEDTVNEVTVTVDASQLSQGLHQCSIKVTDPSASNDPRQVIVTLRVKGTLYVPQQFPTIQGAVNAAMSGEIVAVSEGLYPEYVTVDKQLTLRGQGAPVIDRAAGNVLRLTADGCTVEGFVITRGNVGISIESSDNTISGNLIAGNQRGVALQYNSARNTLTDNELQHNALEGMSIYRSAHNTLRNNHISGSAVGFALSGNSLEDYSQDIDTSNTVDGRPIYCLVGETGVVVDSTSNAACVFAVDCSRIVVRDLTLSHCNRGVCFIATDSSTIENVRARDNEEAGIWLEDSSNNTLTGNAASNSRYGITLFESGGNTLTANTCTANDYNFWCRGDATPHYLQSIDLTNTVDGRPIYYLVDSERALVDAATNAGCVYAVNCHSVTVRDLAFSSNGIGVAFVGTSKSLIENVGCWSNGEAGVLLRDCTDTSLEDCESLHNLRGIVTKGGTDIRIDGANVAANTEGMKFTGSEQVTIVNSVISGNSGWAAGTPAALSSRGGIVAEGGSDLSVMNCTVYGNAGTSYGPYGSGGGGVVCDSSSSATIVNSIIWANRPQQIEAGYAGGRGRGGAVTSTVIVAHSDVQGGFEGVANIDQAPLLTCDGHLQVNSPCIDRGDSNLDALPQADMDGETRFSGRAVDIGADEYADADRDGLPDWWETAFYGSDIAEPDDDSDDDGHENLDEYRWYASDPTLPSATYYVDAGQGDNTNDGQSPESALASIQAAIETARNSDKVLVTPGAYAESLHLLGRQIVLRSTDPTDRDTVASTVVQGPVYLVSGELPGCIVDGLTISPLEDSAYLSYADTGIICGGSSPTIRRCVITGFQAQYSYDSTGVAISCDHAHPAIVACTMSGNGTGSQATVIRLKNSDAVMRNCLVCGNFSSYGWTGGQVVNLTNSKLTVANCTFSQNGSTEQYSWGRSTISCEASELLVVNSILWDDTPSQIASSDAWNVDPSTVKVMYSNVRIEPGPGASWSWPGQGNISVDPCFVERGYWPEEPYYPYGSGTWVDGDYRLKSQGWRWSPSFSHGTHWVWDEHTSLCIDAGNPGSPLGAELQAVPNDPDSEFGRNVRINMGAYGGTARASMAPPGWALLADLTNDGAVDPRDLDLWNDGSTQPEGQSPADLDRDGGVDLADFVWLGHDWQGRTTWSGTMTLLSPATPPQTPQPPPRR